LRHVLAQNVAHGILCFYALHVLPLSFTRQQGAVASFSAENCREVAGSPGAFAARGPLSLPTGANSPHQLTLMSPS
jgi:hypothetical protein